MNIKQRYNKWLFKKYGFNRGPMFENIPVVYKLHPLFSPSFYSMAEGEQICDWFMEGMEAGKTDPMAQKIRGIAKEAIKND